VSSAKLGKIDLKKISRNMQSRVANVFTILKILRADNVVCSSLG
jgi:hypothetical protein